MKALTQRALRVFSVLEDYRAGSPDILDALLPFFEPIISRYTGTILNQAEFAEKVRQAYHWNFTADIVEELIPRFKNKGWVEEVSSTGEAATYRVTYDESAASYPTHEDTNTIEILSSIATQFGDFVTHLSPLTTFDKSEEELADILVEWLISIDAYTEDVLLRHVTKVAPTEGILELNMELEDSSTLENEEKYLCARFVKHMFDNSSPFIPALCKIASIGLLTEVVQDFQKPITSVSKTNIVISLDAPVALDLLGVSGNLAAENIRPIINKLQEIGAKARIFRVSVDELRQALEAVLKRVPAERTGPTADALRRNEVLEAYVREVARDPDSALGKWNIRVVERTLDQFPNEHEHFSREDYESLFAKMTWHLEIPRRERDTTVITLIMRMRRGHHSPDLFGTRQILITRNGALAQSARRFCVENELMPRNGIGPAIHQRQLATAVWLRTGLQNEQQEDVPRRYLLAACERVLALKKNVVDQVRLTAKGLTAETAEQLDLLLTQDRSAQMLMDKTLGVSHVISSTNIDALIDMMKSSLVADIEKEKSGEVRIIRRKAKAQVRAEIKARETAEEEAGELKGDISERDREDLGMVETLVSEVNRSIDTRIRIARVIASFISFIIFIIPVYTGIADGIYRYSGFLLTGALAALLGYYQLLDKPLRIKAHIENWGRRKLNLLAVERGIKSKLERFKVVSSEGHLTLSGPDKPKDLGL